MTQDNGCASWMDRKRPIRSARIAVAAAAALLLSGCPGTDPGFPATVTVSDAEAPVITPEDHVLGAADAPLTVVEYGDFECRACATFFAQTLPAIRAEYIDAGRVRWVYRHFPLSGLHPNAESAAEAAECAGQAGQFWAYHDLLYANYDTLNAAAFRDFAADLGLDATAFEACLASDAQLAHVRSDASAGAALGVAGTPTFFVGSRRLVGAASLDQFRQLLDEALAEAGQ